MQNESQLLQYSLGRQFNNGANKPVTEILIGEWPICTLPAKSAECLNSLLDEVMELEMAVRKLSCKLSRLVDSLKEDGRFEAALEKARQR